MATAVDVRWLHQRPEERLGRYIPSRGADGHMQYIPRHPGDAARLSGDDIERMHAMYRAGGVRSVVEAGDRVLYAPRDPEEVRAMFMQMRATRDAARRGEHEAGWRLDSNRGAMLREAAWREAGRRDAAMGGEPLRAAALQEGAFRDNALHPMARAIYEGAQEDAAAKIVAGQEEAGNGLPPRGVSSGDRGVQLSHPDEYERYYRERNYTGTAPGSGYFGEEWGYRTSGAKGPRMLAVRSLAMDGVHTGDGRHRSVRDLVSQLWFDDFDEATAGAEGLCDLTVPSNPQAAANREVIGATPSVLEGLERLVRSGSPNAAYHACEALSQLSFRNARNAQRIMDARSPDLPAALAALLGLFRAPGQNPPSATAQPTALASLDDDSAFDLRAAVLRVLNNCAWGSPRACADMAEHDALMDAVESVMREAWLSPALQACASAPDQQVAEEVTGEEGGGKLPAPPRARRAEAPVPLIMALDAGVGLMGHLATHPHSRMVLLRRKVAEELLLEMVVSSERLECPPEQYLCTIAGAVEVVIKLIWDEENPPFLPATPVLHTIVWTLVCALDGVMWAGITWSALSRVQALAKLSAVDELKVHLIDLHLVEALVRLLDQWTSEQGVLVLEYALLALLNLLTVEEARFRLYLTGVYRPLRAIVLGDEGASAGAREKAVLCGWLLFEWQVDKLETLDGKVKELMDGAEVAARSQLALEDEYAGVRAELLAELAEATAARDSLFVENQVLRSDLEAARASLVREQAERLTDQEVAAALVASLQKELADRDEQVEDLKVALSEARQAEEYAKQQAADAVADAREAGVRRTEAEARKGESDEALAKCERLAEMRYHEMVVEAEARRRSVARCDALEAQERALVSARDQLQEENRVLGAELDVHEETTRRAVAAAEARADAAEALLRKAVERDEYLSRRAAHLEGDCIRLFNARCPKGAISAGDADEAKSVALAEDHAVASADNGGNKATEEDALKPPLASGVGGQAAKLPNMAAGKRLKVQQKPGSGLWLDAWSTYPEVQLRAVIPPPPPKDAASEGKAARRRALGPGGFTVEYAPRRWQSWAGEYGSSAVRCRAGPAAIYDEADATLRVQIRQWLQEAAENRQHGGILHSSTAARPWTAPQQQTDTSRRGGLWLPAFLRESPKGKRSAGAASASRTPRGTVEPVVSRGRGAGVEATRASADVDASSWSSVTEQVAGGAVIVSEIERVEVSASVTTSTTVEVKTDVSVVSEGGQAPLTSDERRKLRLV